MQRLKGRSVLFGALAVLACSGDPTGNESTPTQIIANPDPVFVTQGDSQAVIVTVVDEDGQVLQADFTASNVGNGISVVFDPTYKEVTTGSPIRREARFFVKGVDLTATTFTLNALGLTRTVDVTSVPGALNVEITDTVPALGDTVTITAAPGTFFTESSVLTFGGAAPVVVSQDATTITFIPFPNIFGPAVVSNVGVESNPNVTFELASTFNVQTDSIIDIGASISNPTPALGDAVTLTLPAGLKVIPDSLQQSGVGADTLPRGMAVANNPVQPRDITVSADSTAITFVPPPNADSFVVVPGIIPQRLTACCSGAPSYPLVLGTTAKLTTPVVDSIPATLSSETPSANEVVTLNVTDAAFTLEPAAEVTVGAIPALVTSRSANSISFVPPPAATGVVTVSGVTIAGFTLALPSKTPSITVGELAPLAGTTGQASAPTLDVPGVGGATTVYDLPDFAAANDPIIPLVGPSAFYKLVIPADGDYTITTNWDIGSDVDQFVCESPIDDVELANCDFAAATGDHPETATYSLTAGTYFIVLNDFGGDAGGATVQITIEQ